MVRSVVEIVVSDYASEGVPDQPDVTHDELEEYARCLRGMRLTYDHVHPAHSTAEKPIKEHVTVADIQEAWMEDDCVHINALIDDGPVGEKILSEIGSKFLTGCSLGLRHKLLQMPDGNTKHVKSLIECSITPKPEFKNARIVGVRPQVGGGGGATQDTAADGMETDGAPGTLLLHTSISASSGERDEATMKRADDILRELKRVQKSHAKLFEPNVVGAVPSAGAPQKTDLQSDTFPRQLAKNQAAVQTEKKMSGTQEQNQNQNQPDDNMEVDDYDAKIADLVARRAQAQQTAKGAFRAPEGTGQGPFRRGLAEMGGPPIHVHNHFGNQDLEHRRMAGTSLDDDGNFRQRYPRRQVGSRGGGGGGGNRNTERPDPSPQHVKYDEARIQRETVRTEHNAGKARTMNRTDAERLEELDRERTELLSGTKFSRHSVEDEDENDSRARRRHVPRKRRNRVQYEDEEEEDDDAEDDNDVEDKVSRKAAQESPMQKELAQLRREMAELRAEKVASIRGKLAAPANTKRDQLHDETREVLMETDDELTRLASLESQFKENDSGELEVLTSLRARRDELSSMADQMKDADRQIMEARTAETPDAAEIAKLRELKSSLLTDYKLKTRDIATDALQFISRTNVAAEKATPTGIRNQMVGLISKNSRASLPEIDNAISLVELVSASSGVSSNTLKSVREQMSRMKRERLEQDEALRENNELKKRHAEKTGVSGEVAAAANRTKRRAIGGRPQGVAHPVDQAAVAAAARAALATETIAAEEDYQGWDPRTALPLGKDIANMTLQEQTGLPYSFVQEPEKWKGLVGSVTVEQKFRQKHPGDAASMANVPGDAHMRVRQGMHRTGNQKMLNMVRQAFGSNERRKNNMMITAGTYRNEKLSNMHKPKGAELRTDPATGIRYFVLGA